MGVQNFYFNLPNRFVYAFLLLFHVLLINCSNVHFVFLCLRPIFSFAITINITYWHLNCYKYAIIKIKLNALHMKLRFELALTLYLALASGRSSICTVEPRQNTFQFQKLLFWCYYYGKISFYVQRKWWPNGSKRELVVSMCVNNVISCESIW